MTSFQKKCYSTLKKVPKGYITNYADLAKAIGHKGAYRAVGSAMHNNPFAPEVPCHRVIKSNGELGGYAKGIEQKINILKTEGIFVINNKVVDFKQKLFVF